MVLEFLNEVAGVTPDILTTKGQFIAYCSATFIVCFAIVVFAILFYKLFK